MKRFNYYYGNTILGYRLFTPTLLEARFSESAIISKPVSNNERSINYNCDKKLLKTTYRKRKKVQLPNNQTVVTVK